jgi:glutamate-1-semialdehyde 2,1-aminomutase
LSDYPETPFEFETAASRRFFERLGRVMPGANTRSATYFSPYPLTLARGEGPFIWDADGNRFIDLVNNYTSLVHGHAHPAIVEAIETALGSGTVQPAPVAQQAELSERITDRIATVDQVRFTNSGTEANMNAIRLARAVTGRDRVLKADWGYHGCWEGLPSLKSEVVGIPGAVRDLVEWVDFNSSGQIEQAMAAHGSEIAAIILEPVLGAGVIPADPEFILEARRAADEHGALLVLDEVVTLRLAHSGYQERLGVRPDLTTFGKIIGGGLPVGALGGPTELMEHFDPRRPGSIPHSGTFNGNMLSMAAGIASLDLLSSNEIERINGLGDRLATGLRTEIARHGSEAVVTRDGSLVQIHFETGPEVRSGSDLKPGSSRLAGFHLAALNSGVFVAPRGEFNVTTAMDATLVDETLERLGQALAAVATSAVSGV